MPPRNRRLRRKNSSSEEEQESPRKARRRGKVCYSEDTSSEEEDVVKKKKSSDEDDMVEVISSDEEESEDDLEAESEEEEAVGCRRSGRLAKNKETNQKKKSKAGSATTTTLRVSSRNNKSTNSMREDSDDEENNMGLANESPVKLLADTDEEDGEEPTPTKVAKKKHRVSNGSSTTNTSDYSEEEDDNDDDDELSSEEEKPKKGGRGKKQKSNKPRPAPKQQKEFEPFRIHRIMASRTETRSTWWYDICKDFSTSAVNSGSRWMQEPASGRDDNELEERFLVKWSDLAYCHCTWELEIDLVELIDGAKPAITVFRRKSLEDGKIYSADERCDGDYFDPAWSQVERILEVHYPKGYSEEDDDDEEEEGTPKDFGVILDENAQGYETGLGRQFFVKWQGLPYSESSYEYERDFILCDIPYNEQVKELKNRLTDTPEKVAKQQQKEGETEFRRLYKEVFGEKSDSKAEDAPTQYQDSLLQTEYPNGGKLRDYQAEGVSWMMSNYINDRNSILADEMGLGKTIQVASFLGLLSSKLQRRGPFLIVVPLSTLGNWKRELGAWLGINTVVYHGNAEDRNLIRHLEMAYEDDRPKYTRSNELFLRKCAKSRGRTIGNPWMMDIVLTTPEMLCTDDYTELTAIDWECLVVDEAHRLKSRRSKVAVNLRDSMFQFGHKILLTGTPIQNNMEELFALLNFVDQSKFPDCEEFLEQYGDMKSKDSLDSLQEEIRPFILRRLKEDVETSVPPKEETIIEVELTISQKQYYRALYEKNAKFLLKNKKKAVDGPSLTNLAMQLRKCCNHLFLLKGIEREFRKNHCREGNMSEGDILAKASGKLVLLDKLLPRLKENGHRLLIFSQFKIMLDVLEDYLDDRSIKFERIDGSITGLKRQQAIDRFQATPAEGKEPPFIMLLSTRAGGVGINLTAADTCIIFDSDFNPQNDLQAQARCHRIGQTKSVKVYRLLSRQTYEMQLFEMASFKMGLDQAVLSGFDSKGESGLSKEEIERLLKRGAYGVLKEDEEGAEAASNDFVQQDLDTILERHSRLIVHENTGSGSAAAGGKFSKARFTTSSPAGKQKSEKEEVGIDDPQFWEKMLGHVATDDNEDVVTGKRARTVQNYSEENYDQKLRARLRDSDHSDDEDDLNRSKDSASDDSEVGDDSFEQGEESESDDEEEIEVLLGKTATGTQSMTAAQAAAKVAAEAAARAASTPVRAPDPPAQPIRLD